MNKRKSAGYEIHAKDTDGVNKRTGRSLVFEAAVNAAHAEGARMNPGKRSWRQPEVFVYEQYSDGSSELVFYEFFVKETDVRAQHRV